MSKEELLKYVRLDSRFVYHAIQIAFEILKKRDYPFTIAEENQINQQIQLRKDEELNSSNVYKWDVNASDERSSNDFFSQKSIWIFSILFGTYIGAILLAINLYSVNKKNEAWLTILFGIAYSALVYFTFKITRTYLINYSILIPIMMIGIGSSILQFCFWNKYLKNIEYRKKG